MSDLVRNPEDRFSHNEAHVSLFYLMNVFMTTLTFPFSLLTEQMLLNEINKLVKT